MKTNDWGENSQAFDLIKEFLNGRNLAQANEAQTRFDIIDRILKEVLLWQHGLISVEEYADGEKEGYIDYTLRSGDEIIVIEAKRSGATFPTPSAVEKLKLSGTILSQEPIQKVIKQATEYGRSKNAKIAIVTNGLCWIYFPMAGIEIDKYATVLHPFDSGMHAERLHEHFCVINVEGGSLNQIANTVPHHEDRLIYDTQNADSRIERNSIANYITPALDNALYADAILRNPTALDQCFISSDARTRFDTMLGMYFADLKPQTVQPARRLRRDKKKDHLHNIVEAATQTFAPPVTLLLGSVGAGKSTYLRHFELISGKDILAKKKAHWVYIDFEEMGPKGKPREFLYTKLLAYLQMDKPGNETHYGNCIEPAYNSEIEGLRKGIYAPIASDKVEFQKKISAHIEADYAKVEPYIDKIFKYISANQLCIIILDNIDLYEDEALETQVFAEGLAMSKRVHAHIVVSLRETTYVKHKADSTFNAYELRKLWLDPPPFKAVLSKRLTYSKAVLKNKRAQITLSNGMNLVVPDLSVFFDIVQYSLLKDYAGDFIEAMADSDIRKGLTLTTNFLTSGHINADRGIKAYLDGQTDYFFPFQEIFKGTLLGQWLLFKESRSDAINLFDARLGSKVLRLARLQILDFLYSKSKAESSLEVPVSEIAEHFSKIGLSETQCVKVLSDLLKKTLIRTISAESLDTSSVVVMNKSGGYYFNVLCERFPYVEQCLYDTAIDIDNYYNEIRRMTHNIEREHNLYERMILRQERMETFLDYLTEIEKLGLRLRNGQPSHSFVERIRKEVLTEIKLALGRIKRWNR